MAVVIKYFGMPSSCVNCDMCLPCALDEGLCYITQHTIGNIYDERPCDCPLVEIQQSEDCVSREQALLQLTGVNLSDKTTEELIGLYGRRIKSLPPVTPTHGTCKNCTNYVVGALDEEICIRGHELIHKDFYCADYEKRGSENENN